MLQIYLLIFGKAEMLVWSYESKTKETSKSTRRDCFVCIPSMGS